MPSRAGCLVQLKHLRTSMPDSHKVKSDRFFSVRRRSLLFY
ncbi:MAG: hypothetical protein AAGD25_04115 [Cyanobacteria bacterium P01_F01_bin.150]